MRGLTGEWTKFRTVVLTVRGDTKSLFLGALLGKAFAGALALVSTAHQIPPEVCALVGMSGLAVAMERASWRAARVHVTEIGDVG